MGIGSTRKAQNGWVRMVVVLVWVCCAASGCVLYEGVLCVKHVVCCARSCGSSKQPRSHWMMNSPSLRMRQESMLLSLFSLLVQCVYIDRADNVVHVVHGASFRLCGTTASAESSVS